MKTEECRKIIDSIVFSNPEVKELQAACEQEGISSEEKKKRIIGRLKN